MTHDNPPPAAKPSPVLPFSTSGNRRHPDSSDVLTMHHLARQRWNEEFGGFIHRERLWKRVAFISLGIALLAVAGVVYMGAQNKLIPYVVAVDKLGTVAAVHRADVAPTPNEPVIRAHLARWIQNTRSIYLDAAAQRAAINEAYASVNRQGPAYTILNEYYQNHDPFKQAQNEAVSVQMESVLPLSGKSWRLEWREEHRGRDGRWLASIEQQATVSLVISPPSDEATLLVNPLGIYVDSFSWTQRL